jgi:hypothetical protein
MRFKLMLLSYLVSLPKNLGFQVGAPFLDQKVALSMLTISPERRRGRAWQQEIFVRFGLDLESMDLKASRQNSLDLQALRRIPLRPLDVDLLREVINPNYVSWINTNVQKETRFDYNIRKLQSLPKVGGVLNRIGVQPRILEAYNAYLTLRPIEGLLKKRNLARSCEKP